MKEKLQAFLASVKTWASTAGQMLLGYLSKITVPVFVVTILAGIVYLVAKYRSLLISLLTKEVKSEFSDAQQKDAELKKQQDAANAEADRLVNEAKDLGDKGAPEDWYKKK